MAEPSSETDPLIAQLVSTGNRSGELARELANNAAVRDQLIEAAWSRGINARAIARAAGITAGRVVQIATRSTTTQEESPRTQDRSASAVFEQQRRAATMRELAEMGEAERDGHMHAYALSGALSREEMAQATGLSLERVNAIIRELAEREQAARNARALEMVRRHSPPEMFE